MSVEEKAKQVDASVTAELPDQNAAADVETEEEGKPTGQGEATKKKNRNKKKKKSGLAPAENDLPEQSNDHLRLIGAWPAEAKSRQTNPASVPVDRCFSQGHFPRGKAFPHPGANGVQRETSVEVKARETPEQASHWDDYRRAAEAHRQTRRFVQSILKPGLTTLEVVQGLEAKAKEMININGLKSGHAFPTGISINHCAAHYTPNYGESPIVLKHGDVVKIDFGVHVNGRLVDSAFTMAFDERFDPLLEATRDGTNTGLKAAGIDARFSEVGAAIGEAISSYEIELDGKIIPIKPIENLNGHTVDLYKVHGGKSLPIVATNSQDIMEEGEVYAIETFASTGRGRVWDEGICSHYMLDAELLEGGPFRIPKENNAPAVLRGIRENFGTLAWCRRWLDDAGYKRHLLSLRTLVKEGIVVEYKPLCDIEGCYTSQFEHTVMLRPTCKEIITRGPDY
eukprot:Protomagalhaensia_sp_Gyna_25__5222@NODE_631_length_2962_cov_488_398905_g490_i0_p1_GENE_NODE_631_length_2962_cov_488_398905_g490_i0NODE_631_length_2962_cov_488_398905_g490_i0_p1_ORF_typecomplete_len454_score78_97Peptidase_M24/PF00557_24/2_6e40_NODE_631_length_2962_cov_488_398905_g490_i010962457